MTAIKRSPHYLATSPRCSQPTVVVEIAQARGGIGAGSD